MSEHELPNKSHGILRSGYGGPTFANSTERIAYVITAADAAQRRVFLQSDTNREYIAHTAGAGAGNWRLIGSGDGGAAGIGGTLGSTDNVVPRSDGTGAGTLQPSPLVITDAGVASGITFADPSTPQQPATKASSEALVTATALRDTHHAADQELVYKVRAVLTAPLPAYTASGTMAGGNRTFTANANGALPAGLVGGVTLITGDKLLVSYNDTTSTDAGVFTITQGTGGTPWVLTQTPGLNTATILQGSTIRVAEGFEAGLWLCRQPTITLGTTPLLWRQHGPPNERHGFYAHATFSENQAGIAGANSSLQYRGWRATAGGTASAITAGTAGTADFATGTATTGTSRLMSQTFAANDPKLEIECGFGWSVAVVSDGTNTFTVSFGLELDTSNFSRIVLTPTAGAAIDLLTTVGGVAGATRNLGTFAINTTYRLIMRKPYGATVYSIYWDDGTGTLTYIADTPTVPASMYAACVITKSAGATSRSLTMSDAWVSVYDPKA